RARKNLEALVTERLRIDTELKEKGLLRSPGESSDPPDRSRGGLLKTTTATYPTLIRSSGFVLVAYCRDEHWVRNALHGGSKTYTSPKSKYNLARSVMTLLRKLVRQGLLSVVIVDTSRCNIQDHGDSIDFCPCYRLYCTFRESLTR